ncbi:IS630 family transposase [Rubellimicrobium rubrum]|uniref:IS630 family transposase n=1 Tax=Rubellimicrobium rubrum TaxID=2585369 RepID=A0A5C4MWQ8_9RHOB|nr:IS630 family transposase [Rubellimicrobium rubrum]TNC50038.1 IS630 family transposase [Rubellimicrobium rubrum]
MEITRTELSATELWRAAARSRDADAARRMLVLALVLEGKSRKEAAESCGMGRQTLRDRVVRTNAEGLTGLSDRVPPGPAFRLTPEQMAEPSEIVEAGPDPAVDHVVRWRRVDLRRVIAARWGVTFHERTVGKLLHRLGFARLSVRSKHARSDPAAQAELGENFSQHVQAALPEQAQGKPIEVWFADETRVGQQGTLTRLWARKGTRPRAPRDCRYAWATLFGAVCPERGVGAGLVMPFADTQAMTAHLAEISAAVAPGTHAVLVLDGAGWHASATFKVPATITLLPAPHPSPELNPVENVWQYLRQNWLSLQVWDDYPAIVEACCQAWTRFLAQPDIVRSVTTRAWARVNG